MNNFAMTTSDLLLGNMWLTLSVSVSGYYLFAIDNYWGSFKENGSGRSLTWTILTWCFIGTTTFFLVSGSITGDFVKQPMMIFGSIGFHFATFLVMERGFGRLNPVALTAFVAAGFIINLF